MPTPATAQWPLPQSAVEWEDMVCDALRIRCGYPDFRRHGRSGQGQYGVDIYGCPEGQFVGADCKLIKRLRFQDVESAVEKAEQFSPRLVKYYYAVSLRRDANLQKQERIFNQNRIMAGKFEVVILFFEDVCQELSLRQELVQKYWALWLPKSSNLNRSRNVIAFCGLKGGIGRTTLSWTTALALASMKKTVLLIDLHPYGTTSTRIASRAKTHGYPIPILKQISSAGCKTHTTRTWENKDDYQRQARQLLLQIGDFQKEYDYIIVDCERELEQMDWAIEGGAGRIILPTRDSWCDLDGVSISARHLKKWTDKTETLQGLVLLNIINIAWKFFPQAQEEIRGWGLPLLQVMLEWSDMYHMCTAIGRSLFDVAPTSSEAYQVARLFRELELPTPALPTPAFLKRTEGRREKRAVAREWEAAISARLNS